jgi:hypothetical protein
VNQRASCQNVALEVISQFIHQRRTEAGVAVSVLNSMLSAGRPKTVGTSLVVT